MSKLALLIAVDDPMSSESSSSEADARAFANALERFWNFDRSEIVLLTSSGEEELLATRANVEKQFSRARNLGRLDSLVVGFWGRAELSPDDRKRRFCLTGFNPNDARKTTVSLGSILSATIRLGAHDACLVMDYRPFNADGEPWTADEEDCQTISNYIRRSEPGARVAALSCCSAGERPLDFEEGKTGLFTKTFIEGMHENARHFQGSFDSVAGYAVQNTSRRAVELGGRQFPYFVTVGEGDISFGITPTFRADSTIDWDEIYGRAPAIVEIEKPEEENKSEDNFDEDSLLVEPEPEALDKDGMTKPARAPKKVKIAIGALVGVALALVGAIVWVWLR